MDKLFRSPLAGIGLAFLLLMLAGCGGTPPASFYALGALGRHAALMVPPPGNPRVSVGPARLPDYLNRPQIVMRLGPNRLVVDEFHRWGGSLEEEFIRVLTEDLSAILGSDRVGIYNEELGRPDYRVAVTVQRFEGVDGREALLKAAWSILDPATGEVLKTRDGLFRRPATKAEETSAPDEPDYERLVAAQSIALADLARAIAADIVELSRRK